MAKTIRMTHSTAMVLQAVANGYVYGFDVMDATGLPGGTVYPVLRRLKAAGLVSSRWEKGGLAHQEGRPPRKYYRLTRDGRAALADAVQRFHVLGNIKETVPHEPTA